MADYAIGDVQGCYDALQRLLALIDFNDNQDRLWFVGDLVNRGEDSLAVLRFIRQLPIKPHVSLGNHDLHLLGNLFGESKRHHPDDTLHAIFTAPDRDEIGHWLRKQSILVHNEALNVVMCHAGIAPCFNLNLAKSCAAELEAALSGDEYQQFFNVMYGNHPNEWQSHLEGMERLRFICNAFTRMRFCDVNGRLVLTEKGPPPSAEPNLYPWFAVPNRQPIDADIVFGHWAALEGKCANPHIYAIDTGCLWGGSLTALRLQDRQRFAVGCEN